MLRMSDLRLQPMNVYLTSRDPGEDLVTLVFKKCLSFPPVPSQTAPRFELHCSSDVVHIRTCSDSCAALMNLIQYVASYGDLHGPHKAEMKPGVPQRKPKVRGRHPSHDVTQWEYRVCLEGHSRVTLLCEKPSTAHALF